MSDDKIFKLLGEFISKEEKSFGGVDKYIISYKQPNSPDPTRLWKHQAVIANLTDDAILRIEEVSAGERFCVHQGKEGGYPVILDITDAKDVPAKSSGGGSKYKGSGGGGNSNWVPKDDSGIAVGAAWTNAIEILKMEGGAPAGEDAVEIVAAIVERVLKIKLAQEERLRASKTAKAAVVDKAVEAPKAEAKPVLSRAEQIKAKKAAEAMVEDEGLEADDLDDVKF